MNKAQKATLAVLVVLMGFLFHEGYYMKTVTDRSGIITEKYIKRSNERDVFMFVIDGEVYENTDTIFFGKWNSADVNAKFKEGDRVNFKTVGWRNAVMSMFPNVIKMEKDDE